MKQRKVYILLYNGAVQFASKDLKTLWGAVCKMAQTINLPLPHSYAQVTRIMADSVSYIHSPGHAHSWEIITRELLFTRRKKTQGNIVPESIHNSTTNPQNPA